MSFGEICPCWGLLNLTHGELSFVNYVVHYSTSGLSVGIPHSLGGKDVSSSSFVIDFLRCPKNTTNPGTCRLYKFKPQTYMKANLGVQILNKTPLQISVQAKIYKLPYFLPVATDTSFFFVFKYILSVRMYHSIPTHLSVKP